MSNPAPGSLETVRAFVNTRDVDDGTDLLTGPAELAHWLAEQGLAEEGARGLRATGPDETTLEPAASGVDGALGRLLAIVARAIEDGTWQRLKVCPADTCQWAFYDASRNRSAVWCDMRVCGNRAKVRGFRERTRAGGAVEDAAHEH